MAYIDTENELLHNLKEKLSAEGYDFFYHPSEGILPPFLEGFQPDAIALRDDRKLVIEVKSRNDKANKKIEQIRKILEEHKGWELCVLFVNQTDSSKDLELTNKKTIEQALEGIKALYSEGNLIPALIMASATFEAISRSLLPDKFKRPQTPGRLVEIMSYHGEIDVMEADIIRSLIPVQNRVVHGDLEVEINPDNMKRYIEILEILTKNLPD